MRWILVCSLLVLTGCLGNEPPASSDDAASASPEPTDSAKVPDAIPRPPRGVAPRLEGSLGGLLDDRGFQLPDVTGLVAAFPPATQTLTRLTIQVPASAPPSLRATERDASWRGFELPKDRGGRASATPQIDLSEARVKIFLVDSNGRPDASKPTPQHKVVVKVGSRSFKRWSDLFAQLQNLSDGYRGSSRHGLPVILDVMNNVPACYAVVALGHVLSKGWPVTLSAPAPDYETPAEDWRGDLKGKLQAALATLPQSTGEAALPQAGVRIRAAALTPWGEVGKVIEVCASLGIYRVTFASKLGDDEVDLGRAGQAVTQRAIRVQEFVALNRDLHKTPRVESGTPVEKPIIVLEEEVELTQDVPKKGLDLSNRSLDSTSLNDAYGVGGGAAGAYGSRWGKGSLSREGGSAGSESSVTAALRWLKFHQSSNGSWDSQGWEKNCRRGTCKGPGTNAGDQRYDVGNTSLALLAFMGNGHTHRFGTFKRTVSAGLKWLKSQQRPDGSVGFRANDGESIYNHALATIALCEAYAISRDFRLKTAATQAAQFCLAAQNPGLGWRYGTKPGQNDTSITGWMILALQAAKSANIEVPDAAIAGARAWLVRATARDGRVGYATPGGRSSLLRANDGKFDEVPTMTAVSVGCRILMGEKGSEDSIRKGVKLVSKSLPTWAKGGSTKAVNFYYWHHGTTALFQAGGADWKAWNKALQSALLSNQRMGGCEDGSWDPVGEWCLAGGRVYATAINALTLETYYRDERRR